MNMGMKTRENARGYAIDMRVRIELSRRTVIK